MIKQQLKITAVCVCTAGTRKSLLNACLTSLMQQELPSLNSMIIIVIDNSVNGEVESTVKNDGIFDDNFVFYREKRQGIPFARNAAIHEAVGVNADYIAFIDDDEIAPLNWLSRLIIGINANGADVIVGEVGRCESLEEAIKSSSDYHALNDLKNLTQVKTAVTSNVLLKTELVLPPLSIDFDEKMVFGGSDREFFMRAVLAGKKIVFDKSNVVFETWPQSRREVSYLLMRWLRYGVSFNYRYRKNLPPTKAYIFIWSMCFYKLLMAPIKLVVAPIRRIWDKRSLRRLIGMSVADIAYGLGCIAPFIGIKLNKYY
ncbi:MAG: glycosyltransferase [Piscirickettsiaceae bacterium]|nr:glycosyltransferase [Piscirickettsiaceae bacterium]